MNDESKDVFSGTQILKSMRSSGYKNTAYALAEIIDNSVEAKATNIEVLCAMKPDYSHKKTSLQFNMIAIADNGEGMTEDQLWNSLIMGEGTRYEAKSIGKFGMGLPNSSISQCKTVQVYSWQKPDQIFVASLDLTKSTTGLKIHKPQKTEIPEIWKNKSKILQNTKSGTLVVWSNLDGIKWKQSTTLVRNFERITGRVYRKFIDRDKLKINFIAFNSETHETTNEETIRPNDPIYQIVPSNTPEPWNNNQMFEKDGDNLEKIIDVEGHPVKIRCSVAKKEARKVKNGIPAGSQPHGKHANSNLGISVIRANRELYLDTNLCQTYDPLERWWGVEVEFPNELDDVFGVTNNKQDASNFSAMTHSIGAISRAEDENKDNDDEDNDDLRKLVVEINTRIHGMRRTIKNTNTGPPRGSPSGPDPPIPEDPDGTLTVTHEQDTSLTLEEKQDAITEALAKISDPASASDDAKRILDEKIKTVLKKGSLGNYTFFDVTFQGGVSIITLNTDHLAYKYLIKNIEKIHDSTDSDDATQFSTKILAAMNSLFASWAYYENHTINDEERKKLTDVRYEWHKRLEKLLQSLET